MAGLLFVWQLVWGSLVGRIMAGVVVGLIALKSYGLYEQRVGARKVVEKSKIEGKKRNANAQRKHAEARKPGAADRLLRDSCRDC